MSYIGTLLNSGNGGTSVANTQPFTNIVSPTTSPGGNLLNDTIASVMSPNTQKVFTSNLLQLTTGLVLTSGTAYFVYLGYTTKALTGAFVQFRIVTAGVGTQTGEVGFFSTPNAPSKAGQTLTKIAATGTLNSLTTTGVSSNTTTMAAAISAGTHLWAGIRTAMGTTQPSLNALTLDNSVGSILITAASGALTASSTFVGSLIPQAITAQAPSLQITLV